MKDALKTFKELWKNPKTHAVMVLALWFIFIGILSIFLMSMNSSNKTITRSEKVSEDLENNSLEKITSYEFTYNLGNIQLNGLWYRGKYLLYLDNNKYYKNDILYKITESIEVSKEPELLKIDNNMINSLIKNIDPIKNNEYESYYVPLAKFINVYENVDSTDYSYNITINLYKQEKVNKITIDLTNYYKVKGMTSDNYILTIKYFNINKINDFTQEYDSMIGVK